MYITKSEQNEDYNLLMNTDDLCSLLEMIKSAPLPVRRSWFNIKKQIESIID